jgi:dimethylaniline monooxygenase (N-oxide forming)
VLVYGGGESASDVVELLARTPARITWAIPDGQHFFRKSNFFARPAPGEYRVTDSALDEASSRFIQHIISFGSMTKSKPGMKWLCLLGSTGSVMGYEGHGVPQWKKGVPFMHAMVNKNGHAVEFVHSGRAQARGKIVHAEGKTITFEDGASEHVTHVILCTGYEYSFPYLPPEHAQKSIHEHYKMIFDPDDPSLLLIGYARPVVSSIPLMTEIQCMYAFRVLTGQVALPDGKTMRDEIQKDIARDDQYFLHRRRSDNLVSPFIYGYDLAKRGGFNPNYLKLFFQSPRDFFKTYFSPVGAAHFLLNDRARRKDAVDLIWSHQQGRWFVFPWIYIIARLLKVDAILDILKERKYKKQRRELRQD